MNIQALESYLLEAMNKAEERAYEDYDGDGDQWHVNLKTSFYTILAEEGHLYRLIRKTQGRRD